MYDEKYRLALKKVKRKRRFIIHAIIFVFGSIFLFFLNYAILFTYTPWFLAPVSVWALALFLHAIYAYTGLLTKEWIENEVKKEMEKLGDTNELDLESFDKAPLPLRRIQKETKNPEDEEFV